MGKTQRTKQISLKELQYEVETLKTGQSQIIHRLDTVSANGTPGFENSLKDIYNKLSELHKDLLHIQEEEKAKWFNMTVIQLARKSWMKPIWVFVILIVINTIFKQLGIELDIPSLLKLSKF